MLRIGRSRALRGSLRPPSDKSLTHRALVFSAIATGPSRISNPLRGEDCTCTRRILEQLGTSFVDEGDTVVVDPGRFPISPSAELDCGNSGTTMRLMAGLLAAQPGLTATLVGDESLSQRPMRRVIDPLRLMGADLEGDTAPLTIKGRQLHGISYDSPVASAQIKSAILLAGLFAEGQTVVREPSPSRDHTERMLSALGITLQSEDGAIGLVGGQRPGPLDFDVPADISSAAFFMAAAAIVPGSFVVLREVGVNPTRTGVLEVLASTGAPIGVQPQDDRMGEPVASIAVSYKDELMPFEISGDLVPRLIDEIPVLSVVATQCNGTSTIRDARELRVKESDRIETVATNLRAMGASVETFEDGLAVTGPTALHGATVNARGDHRIGMAFAVAGLVADGETLIENADSIASSYPGFVDDLDSLRAVAASD